MSCAHITSCASIRHPSVCDPAGMLIVRPYTSMCKPRADLPWSLAGATAVSTTPRISRSSIPRAAPSMSGEATSRALNSS